MQEKEAIFKIPAMPLRARGKTAGGGGGSDAAFLTDFQQDLSFYL